MRQGSVRSGVLFGLVLALAGCAGAPPAPDGAKRPELIPAHQENPQARIRTELAGEYFRLRQHAIALQELRSALMADPNYAPAYNLLGLVHADLGEDREAEANFRRAISLSPQFSDAHTNYGVFLCQRRRHDEAMERFEAALRNPLYAAPERALAHAARCLLRQGEVERAENFAQRALARAPAFPPAIFAMAEIQFRLGNPLAARARLRQLAEFGELDAAALWLGVRIERQLGQREAEAAYGAQLRRRFPESIETRWLLNGQYDQPGGER